MQIYVYLYHFPTSVKLGQKDNHFHRTSNGQILLTDYLCLELSHNQYKDNHNQCYHCQRDQYRSRLRDHQHPHYHCRHHGLRHYQDFHHLYRLHPNYRYYHEVILR